MPPPLCKVSLLKTFFGGGRMRALVILYVRFDFSMRHNILRKNLKLPTFFSIMLLGDRSAFIP